MKAESFLQVNDLSLDILGLQRRRHRQNAARHRRRGLRSANVPRDLDQRVLRRIGRRVGR